MNRWIWSLTIALFPIFVFAQIDTAEVRKVIIGIKEAPPFVRIDEQGNARGLSIDFWEMVNSDIAVPYEYKIYSELSEMLKAVESGEIQLSINPVTITEQRMKDLDFSLPFFISETAIAQKERSTWAVFIENLFSGDFWRAIAVLLGLLLAIGILMWLAERRRNSEQFPSDIRGLGSGFWWSAVTMTTVGYGDKSPVTPLGRFIGLVWMFTAIILISSLTAGIASALTVQRLGSQIRTIRDLEKFEVVTVQGSSSEELLTIYQVPHRAVRTVEEALEQLKSDQSELVVYDRPILNYYIENFNDYSGISIADKHLKTDYYSFTFPKHSVLSPKLDPIIVKKLKSPEWNFILERNAR